MVIVNLKQAVIALHVFYVIRVTWHHVDGQLFEYGPSADIWFPEGSVRKEVMADHLNELNVGVKLRGMWYIAQPQFGLLVVADLFAFWDEGKRKGFYAFFVIQA